MAFVKYAISMCCMLFKQPVHSIHNNYSVLLLYYAHDEHHKADGGQRGQLAAQHRPVPRRAGAGPEHGLLPEVGHSTRGGPHVCPGGAGGVAGYCVPGTVSKQLAYSTFMANMVAAAPPVRLVVMLESLAYSNTAPMMGRVVGLALIHHAGAVCPVVTVCCQRRWCVALHMMITAKHR